MKKIIWVFLLLPFLGIASKNNLSPISKNCIKLIDPTPEIILKKYLDVVLDKTKYEDIKDIELIGTGTVMGQTMEMTQRYIFKDANFCTKMNMGTMGTILYVAKINNEFKMKQQGTDVPIDDKMKPELIEQGTYFIEKYYLENKGYSLKLVGSETVDGKDAYNVEITSQSNNTINFYFDKATGLKLRMVITVNGNSQIFNYSDYLTVNGILFPSKTSIDPGQGFTIDIEYKNIKVNSGLTVKDLQ